jgi:VCBS repeat-containing protein
MIFSAGKGAFMKTRQILISLFTVFCLLLANTSTAFAMPPLPSSFYGTVQLDGVDAAAGTWVTAWINDVQYASAQVIEYGGRSVYSLDIAGDDSETSGIIEGGTSGATIIFKIDGETATQTGIWHGGTNVELNLTAFIEHTFTAVDDSYSTNEDTILNVPAAGVLANDIESLGYALTASKVSDPSHGNLTLNSDGSFDYQPDADFNGSDSFTYKANNSINDSNVAVVTITVNPVNDAPVCTPVSLNTYKNTLGWADPACSDVEGDALTFAIASQPAHGAAALRSNRLRYIPAYNFYGSDSFTYTASDGLDVSSPASVSVSVSSAVLPTRAPTVPAPASPANRALLFDLTPRFDWGSSRIYSGTAFDFYHLQAATDAAFANLVIDQEIPGLLNSEFTPAVELSENTRYYWRVRSFNSLGQFSAWSSSRYFRQAMPSPVLLEMSGGIFLDNLRPTFDWQDVPGAASYTFQISSKPNMSGASGATVPASTYTPAKDLAKNKSLYYRVRANGENGPSSWSETFSVITPNTPTTPKLSLPKNKALVSDLTPRLDWSNSSVPSGVTFDHYQVQLATDALFSVIVIDENISGLASNSEFTLTSDLAPNTRYYWRVRAFNSLDQYSSWSTVSYFREAMLAPDLSSPANGAALDNLRPAFDWLDVDGASSYTVQISSSASMSSASSTKVTASAYSPAKDLPKNRTLYWRVRAEGENGPGNWSEIRSLITPNTPNTPALLSPANNALLTNRLPRLDWSDSAIPAGTIFDHYQLQLATDAAFADVVRDEDVAGLPADSEYTLFSELSPNTTYYWRVRSFNSLGQFSSWSSTRCFRQAMDAPELLSPVYGAFVPSLKPTFDWEDVAGASSYSFQLSSSASMSGASSYSISTSTYTPAKNLGANKSYYWRVRALGVNGPSEWSEVRLIVTPGS